MKRVLGGKELLVKAKTEAKRRNRRRIKSQDKRLAKRQAKKLVGISGAPPVSSA